MKKKVRNLLVVGRTGGGKSALANVLCGTDNFEESEYSVSKTEKFKKQDFEWNGTKYCVVDTVGIGNTRLPIKEVLDKIAEGIYSMPEGISQVLFVVDGIFIAEEIETFKLFVESGIAKYITIVRTKFVNFKNKAEREKDKKNLCDESKTIAKIVKSCRSIIYVENPPVNILVNDDDDKEAIRINKKKRLKSREILLDHLEEVCQGEYYKLKTWDNLRDKIARFEGARI